MPTYSNRVSPTGTWNTKTVLWGSYLTDVNGDYILTVAGQRIIVITANGSLNLNIWSNRVIPN